MDSASCEHETSTANASVFSAKVLIPFLQKELCILNNSLSNRGHLIRAETPHVGDRYRLKPKLCVAFGIRDVDVQWLAPFQAKEEEPIPPNSENGGHFPSLAPIQKASKTALGEHRQDSSPQVGLCPVIHPWRSGEDVMPKSAHRGHRNRPGAGGEVQNAISPTPQKSLLGSPVRITPYSERAIGRSARL